MNAATVLPASAAARPGIDAPTVRRPALSAWQALERGIDRWTGAALNPLHHLGSMAFLCFWTLAASGITYLGSSTTAGTTTYFFILAPPTPPATTAVPWPITIRP